MKVCGLKQIGLVNQWGCLSVKSVWCAIQMSNSKLTETVWAKQKQFYTVLFGQKKTFVRKY